MKHPHNATIYFIDLFPTCLGYLKWKDTKLKSTLVAQHSVTKIIATTVSNLVTFKAAAKHGTFAQKLTKGMFVEQENKLWTHMRIVFFMNLVTPKAVSLHIWHLLVVATAILGFDKSLSNFFFYILSLWNLKLLIKCIWSIVTVCSLVHQILNSLFWLVNFNCKTLHNAKILIKQKFVQQIGLWFCSVYEGRVASLGYISHQILLSDGTLVHDIFRTFYFWKNHRVAHN